MSREEILTAAAKISLANNFIHWGDYEDQQIKDRYDDWLYSVDDCTPRETYTKEN